VGDRDKDVEGDLDYGGDDDDVPTDGPQTLRDLTREWNKGTQRGRDITSFREPMPAEDLPGEDAALRELVERSTPPASLPRAMTLDALLQPSPAVVAGDMGPWVRQALRWAGPDLASRSLAHLVQPTASALQDPHGRVLFGRARAGAIATLLALEGPLLSASPAPSTTAFVDLCMELAGQRPTLLGVWWRAQQAQLKLPVGAEIARQELAGRRDGRGRAVTPDDTAAHHLDQVLRDLLDLPSATSLVPHVPEVPTMGPDLDDPLGLDEVLAAHTGGRPDPLASIYATTMHGAERLASAVARTRVRFAGIAVALAEVGDHWVSGAPVGPAQALVAHADGETQRILSLLVEIAQAARRRAVDPQGIRNGLRRAAKLLDKVVASTLRSFARLAAGLLPELPDLPPLYAPPADDPLAACWADGQPGDALPWLAEQPDSLAVRAARRFTEVGAGRSPSSLVKPLLALADDADPTRPLLGQAARLVAGSCALWADDLDTALTLGSALREQGRSRRNGLMMVCGALLQMEVHQADDDPGAREDVRTECAIDAWHMGQRAALTLLLRWEEPDLGRADEALDELFDAAFT
jgi:hypothetical protein